MFPDVSDIRKTRKRLNWQMYQSGVETFRAMGEVEENALKDGVLPQTTKELIALGISIANSCYG